MIIIAERVLDRNRRVSFNEGDIGSDNGTKICFAVQFHTYSLLLLCLCPSAGIWT